jgi:uncharacterized membrane protein
MWRAHRSGELAVITATARHVVSADWLFTTVPGVVQLVTGLWLATELGYALSEPWLLFAFALFLLALGFWLPVAWLQIRMRNVARAARASNARCRRPTTAASESGSRSAGRPSSRY